MTIGNHLALATAIFAFSLAVTLAPAAFAENPAKTDANLSRHPGRKFHGQRLNEQGFNEQGRHGQRVHEERRDGKVTVICPLFAGSPSLASPTISIASLKNMTSYRNKTALSREVRIRAQMRRRTRMYRC